MGMRSTNALVVKSCHAVPDVVATVFESAAAYSHEGFNMWIWETNISPLWARTGVWDLKEEVTIFSWLLSLPLDDYQLIRCGEELGILGELAKHPFRYTQHEAYWPIVLAYNEELLAASIDEEGRTWAKGSPVHQGWYLANPTRTGLSWRFWNGKNWSMVGLRGMTAAQAAEAAKWPECEAAEKQMWWSDYWPEGLVLNRSCTPPAETNEMENAAC